MKTNIKIKLHDSGNNSEFFEIKLDGVSVYFDLYDFQDNGKLKVFARNKTVIAIFDEPIAKRFFDWVER